MRIALIVAGVYQPEKIPESERLSVPNVIAEINRCTGDGRARSIINASDIATHIASHAVSGDIVLVMSNGAFDGVLDRILQALAG